jgi:hypothetical protein
MITFCPSKEMNAASTVRFPAASVHSRAKTGGMNTATTALSITIRSSNRSDKMLANMSPIFGIS